MGGAGVALMGDAGSLFVNPAGMATIGRAAWESGYRRVAGESFLLSGAAAGKVRQFDLGLGIKYLGLDSSRSIPAWENQPYELEGVGALVYRWGLLALGGSLRYLRRSLASGAEDGVSGDLGVAVAFFDIMAIGFAVRNLGHNWRSAGELSLPGARRLGFTMNYVDPQEAFRLTSVLEIQWTEVLAHRLLLGGEAGLVLGGVGIVGRGAYHSRSVADGEPAFSFGASLALGPASLDYAYAERDRLGAGAHCFGLRLRL